jgi:hypothetical protein
MKDVVDLVLLVDGFHRFKAEMRGLVRFLVKLRAGQWILVCSMRSVQYRGLVCAMPRHWCRASLNFIEEC